MPGTRSRLILAGGAGFIGRVLARHFSAAGWEIIVLTRRPRAAESGTRFVGWDGESVGAWAAELEGADALVNLAGRTVNCRYTARNRQEIYDSRLKSTAALGAAIAKCEQPPKVWLNSASATIYRHALDRPMDETTGEIGSGFSVDVCQRWERAFFDAPTPATRRVALRAAMVFGPGSGGVFEAFHRIVRMGLGGTLGRGEQFVSWIHERDFARAVEWLIARDDVSGVVNLASPNPLPNHEFMRVFRQACGMRIGLPAACWMLEIGAFFLRTETELLLKSRRVVPGRLRDSGFTFEFPELRAALSDIVRRA
jgi:uncharacterized protein (TIGR01777 family)